MRVRLEFKLEDCWVGAYWRPGHLWVCVVPMLPLHFMWSSYKRVAAEAKLDEVVRAYGEQCAERAAREPELEWQRIATELLEGSDG